MHALWTCASVGFMIRPFGKAIFWLQAIREMLPASHRY